MSGIGYVVKSMGIKIKEGTTTAVDVACAITGVTDAPSTNVVTTTTACPDGAISDSGPTTWAVTVEYNAVDKPDSLHRLLREHAGKPATLSVEYDPIGDPGRITEYDVTLTPGSNNAPVGAYRTGSVTLPVKGAPRVVDPAAPVTV